MGIGALLATAAAFEPIEPEEEAVPVIGIDGEVGVLDNGISWGTREAAAFEKIDEEFATAELSMFL